MGEMHIYEQTVNTYNHAYGPVQGGVVLLQVWGTTARAVTFPSTGPQPVEAPLER